MTKIKMWYTNILYRLLDRATKPMVKKIPAQKIPETLDLKRVLPTVKGGDAYAWHHLQNRRQRINAGVMSLEVYACLDDTKLQSVDDVAEKLNVARTSVSPLMSNLYTQGFLIRIKGTPAPGAKCKFYYKRRLNVQEHLLQKIGGPQ